MILEGLVTTLDASGAVNFAPMGPIVEPDFSRFELRPYQTSQTYRNLKTHPQGVLHVVDDVLLIARAALDRLASPPQTTPAERVQGRVLADCCRWFEFEVRTLDDSAERTSIIAEVVHTARRRDFFGFNRAKHAVLEATILATRLHLLPRDEILAELKRLKTPVDKTAGPQEFAAWKLVCDYIGVEG
ncbi:MAG TPA: DUF447 domain-containing protein [Planctomycetaceae bacterium]|nr:DUF447 domain-containing protein [Planctomycetaceae bacterium]